MHWLIGLVIVATAVLTWLLLVPRLRIDDEQAPDLRALVTLRSTLVLGLAATAAAVAVLLAEPAHRWWLWVAYLGLGLPLIAIDLRTTFLPKRLNAAAGLAMAAAAIPLTTTHWQAGVGAALGAAAACGFFYAAWRLSPTLGFGDVRLALLTGAVSGQGGLNMWATALLAGTLLGATHGIGHALWARRAEGRPRHFPFGPALWLGPVAAAVLAASGS